MSLPSSKHRLFISCCLNIGPILGQRRGKRAKMKTGSGEYPVFTWLTGSGEYPVFAWLTGSGEYPVFAWLTGSGEYPVFAWLNTPCLLG